LVVLLVGGSGLGIQSATAQPVPNQKNQGRVDVFRQLEEWLPTPNVYRTGAGSPGPRYWQQRADYEIDVTLDDENQRLEGTARIDYHNQSPVPLHYIWVQLDQNIFNPQSTSNRSATGRPFGSRLPFSALQAYLIRESFDGGYKLSKVVDGQGEDLPYTVVDTMMRIDLPEPLGPGMSTRFEIGFSFNIVDATVIRARGGYEFFEDDGNYIYEMAQWFPRVVSYTDYTGWQHKQFLGSGEFTLEMGDYLVRITAPADHIVGATGVLQNPQEVLSETHRERLEQARDTDRPIFIVTPEEAEENEAEGSEETKTWVFRAEDVRDFAFCSSRKFIWDAMLHKVGDQEVYAMSYYPNEAEPLWSQYSTASIIHTLNVYSRYTFEYPYPTAISVNGPVYGMEYPMICFNGPRPEEDGTYSARTKYALISVIIHEVGHNYFPMIVNSDERQWTWMDEGLNTFLQYLAEQEWEDDYPSRRGEPQDITGYMASQNQVPIMTNSESILQFGANAYAKPATALNILRETILGRELFDYAFKEYARRWKFKRPTPADFFRTMEDASGIDLDWFWRGWFYSTDHVDIAIEGVQQFVIDSGDPDAQAERERLEREAREPSLSEERNEELPKMIDHFPGLKDFYNEYDPYEVQESERKAFQKFLESLDEDEQKLLRRKTNFYLIEFSNQGGLVMPIIVRMVYEDGSHEMVTVPAEIWRRNSENVSKMVISDKQLVRVELDPRKQTADVDYSNNHWPPKLEPTRFELYKSRRRGGDNPMRRARKAEEKEAEEKEAAADKAEAKQDAGGEDDDPQPEAGKSQPEKAGKAKPAKGADAAPSEDQPADGEEAEGKESEGGQSQEAAAEKPAKPADESAEAEPAAAGQEDG
jgi:hypothetical protein